MMKAAGIVIAVLGLWLGEAMASMADFAPAFEIDLDDDEDLPLLEDLQDFFEHENTVYDARYHSVFDLGDVFDKGFGRVISTYGMTERRIIPDSEEMYMELLASLPPEQYEYVGPMLFLVPGMSEKILNLPEIKKTKNKFPSRVAEQLKDIEDLEFLSPYLYYILMPEAWEPQPIPAETVAAWGKVVPKVYHNPQFYAFVKKLVPPQNYMPNAKEEKKITRSDMRTIPATKDALLTSADVQAFVRTIDGVQDWLAEGDNLLQIYRVGSMWTFYEMKHPEEEKSLPVPQLKDMANPCQRLVQKAVILGREVGLAKAVVKEGFSLNEWAYTCDKAMKAYRVAHISLAMLTSLNMYRKGLTDKYIGEMTPRNRKVVYSTMQAIDEMYKAPMSDVIEVRKNLRDMDASFKKHDFEVFGQSSTGRLD